MIIVITRSFNLKVSAGVRAGRKYGEYSLKRNKVKKMKMTLGIRLVFTTDNTLLLDFFNYFKISDIDKLILALIFRFGVILV